MPSDAPPRAISPAPEQPPVLSAAASDTGLRRENNEDRYHCDPARGVFMVIDGVGGQAAGEKAAETARSMLCARLERETGAPEERVREAITLANNEIHRLGQSQPAWQGMACVLTVALVADGRLVVGHVGDTRLYLFEGGRVQKLTHDHSPVGEREDCGELDEREAMGHPRRNEIFRDVGSEPHSPGDADFIEIVDRPFRDDQALVLCSDGLSDLVTSTEQADIVYAHADEPEAIVSRLVEAANARGGKDNVTAVFVAGHRFAERARAQAGARHEPSRPLDTPRPPHDAPPRGRRARVLVPRWLVTAAALMAGLLLGVGLSFLAITRTDALPEWILQANRPDAWTRTWTVGYEAGADFTTIDEALARAKPGDTIQVGPGEYRAPLQMRPGIDVVSTKRREAIIRPAPGATPSAAVVFAADTGAGSGSRLVGFRVAGDAEHPMDAGVVLREGAGTVEDVEIVGASTAGIAAEWASRGSVRGCYLHDNPGVGIVVHSGAAPQLFNNVITANGKADSARPLPGLELKDGANPGLFGNIVRGNGDDQVVGAPAARRADIARDNIVGAPQAPQRRGVPGAANR
jgi:PPM family protein phosphatase